MCQRWERCTDVGLGVADEEVPVVAVLVEQRVAVRARDGAVVPGAARRRPAAARRRRARPARRRPATGSLTVAATSQQITHFKSFIKVLTRSSLKYWYVL